MSTTLDALRRLTAGAFALLRTRAEFATLELAQARERILGWCIRGLIAILMAALALSVATALLVALLWPHLGPWSLSPFVLLYGGIAWWMLDRLARDIDAAPAPLAETMRQLAEDQQAMAAALGAGAQTSADETSSSAATEGGRHES